MNPTSLPRRVLAEFLGTGLLVAVVVGSGIAAQRLSTDPGVRLLENSIATTLGLDFDPDKSWDEKKEVYRLSNQIVRTQNVTQTAIGDKKGLWTTVVAASVLIG